MLGDDITYIDEDRLSVIKKTLPRPKDIAVPVDLFTPEGSRISTDISSQNKQPLAPTMSLRCSTLKQRNSINRG